MLMQVYSVAAALFCPLRTRSLPPLYFIYTGKSKEKVKLSLCLTNKHYTMKTYGGMDV
jgi:hypothetical protein